MLIVLLLWHNHLRPSTRLFRRDRLARESDAMCGGIQLLGWTHEARRNVTRINDLPTGGHKLTTGALVTVQNVQVAKPAVVERKVSRLTAATFLLLPHWCLAVTLVHVVAELLIYLLHRVFNFLNSSSSLLLFWVAERTTIQKLLNVSSRCGCLLFRRTLLLQLPLLFLLMYFALSYDHLWVVWCLNWLLFLFMYCVIL